MAALVLQRQRPNLVYTASERGQPLAVGRERRRKLDRIALPQRLRLARSVGGGLEDTTPKPLENYVLAVRAPDWGCIKRSAECQARHSVPLQVVDPHVETSSLADLQRYALAIGR